MKAKKCDRTTYRMVHQPGHGPISQASDCKAEAHGYWLTGHLGPIIHLCDEHGLEYPDLATEVDGEIRKMTPEEELLSDIHHQ